MAHDGIFLSHSSADRDFANALAHLLRNSGMDVWYDDGNMASGNLMKSITQELSSSKAFVIILSKAALSSEWVRQEARWAVELAVQDPTRIIVPVMVSPVEPTDLTAGNGWLFLRGFQSVTVADHDPYAQADAVGRALQLQGILPYIPPSTPEPATDDEPVSRSEAAPPPPPATEAPAEEAPTSVWPYLEDERALPPDAAPVPYPEQPSAQPPSAPPPSAPPPSAPPPPAPGAAPQPSPHLDQVGGAASDRQRGADTRHRPVETLQFSAYHPNEAPVEAWQTLLVYAHLPAHLRQVQADAGTFTELGSAPTVAQGQALRKIPRNVEITIEPHVEGVTFSPAQDSFIWRGEWHRSLFRYSGAKELAGTTRKGWIDIYAERVSPICTIEVVFSFHSGVPSTSLSVLRGVAVTSNTFDTVFISYSHRDREPMQQALETYRKMNIAVYNDNQLEAGDNYEQRLSGMIRSANVFHLLWSDASAQSAEVRKEWALALECQKGEKFIRPWYWQQPIVPPPPELRARKISFRYEHLRRKLLRPSTWL